MNGTVLPQCLTSLPSRDLTISKSSETPNNTPVPFPYPYQNQYRTLAYKWSYRPYILMGLKLSQQVLVHFLLGYMKTIFLGTTKQYKSPPIVHVHHPPSFKLNKQKHLSGGTPGYKVHSTDEFKLLKT